MAVGVPASQTAGTDVGGGELFLIYLLQEMWALPGGGIDILPQAWLSGLGKDLGERSWKGHHS